MKYRSSFVTNSSSSSFIISKKFVTREKLVEILLEIANKEKEYYEDDYRYTTDDIEEDCVAYRYHITEASPENPYDKEDYNFWTDEIISSKKYCNHYVVDNESCVRYSWDVIDEVLSKYNIPWEYGYCD